MRSSAYPLHRSGPIASLQEMKAQLRHARDAAAVIEVVRRAARDLTGADGACIVLREGPHCCYVEENAIEPLWKGRRFPLSACISGWAIMHAQPVVIENIYDDPRIPAAAYRPTFVHSLVMAPIGRLAPIGAIGNYWAERRKASEDEVATLQAVADAMLAALEAADRSGSVKSALGALTGAAH